MIMGMDLEFYQNFPCQIFQNSDKAVVCGVCLFIKITTWKLFCLLKPQ